MDTKRCHIWKETLVQTRKFPGVQEFLLFGDGTKGACWFFTDGAIKAFILWKLSSVSDLFWLVYMWTAHYLHVVGGQFGWILWVDSRHATKPSHHLPLFLTGRGGKDWGWSCQESGRTGTVLHRIFAQWFSYLTEIEFISSGSLGHCHRLTSAAEQGEFDVPSVKQRKTLKQLPLQQESIYSLSILSNFPEATVGGGSEIRLYNPIASWGNGRLSHYWCFKNIQTSKP